MSEQEKQLTFGEDGALSDPNSPSNVGVALRDFVQRQEAINAFNNEQVSTMLKSLNSMQSMLSSMNPNVQSANVNPEPNNLNPNPNSRLQAGGLHVPLPSAQSDGQSYSHESSESLSVRALADALKEIKEHQETTSQQLNVLS